MFFGTQRGAHRQRKRCYASGSRPTSCSRRSESRRPVQRNRLREPERFLWGHVRIDQLRPKIEAGKQVGVQPTTIVARLIANADSCRETETAIRVFEGLADIKPGRPGPSENVWKLGDDWSPSTIEAVPNGGLGCGSDGSGATGTGSAVTRQDRLTVDQPAGEGTSFRRGADDEEAGFRDEFLRVAGYR
jgi:hypothetical protein